MLITCAVPRRRWCLGKIRRKAQKLRPQYELAWRIGWHVRTREKSCVIHEQRADTMLHIKNATDAVGCLNVRFRDSSIGTRDIIQESTGGIFGHYEWRAFEGCDVFTFVCGWTMYDKLKHAHLHIKSAGITNRIQNLYPPFSKEDDSTFLFTTWYWFVCWQEMVWLTQKCIFLLTTCCRFALRKR